MEEESGFKPAMHTRGNIVLLTEAELIDWLDVPEMDDDEALRIFRTTEFLHTSVKPK